MVELAWPAPRIGQPGDTAWHPFERAWQQPAPEGGLRVVPGDADYERQLALEVDFWSRPQMFCVEAEEGRDLPSVRRANRRFTGNERVAWYETLQHHGTFKKGLTVGAGGLLQASRMLELNPELHLTFTDISESALAQRAALEARFPGRVATGRADLNFLELDAAEFDLIVSSSTLHHLINIEHVAAQINLALTDDGYFFMQDYTAETRFAWKDQKRRIFELLVSRERARRGEAARPVTWKAPVITDFSPFEAIRSADTLEVLARVLHEHQVVGSGALPVLRLWIEGEEAPTAGGRLGAVMAKVLRKGMPDDEMTAMDEVLCDAGVLLPVNSFGIYRKRMTRRLD